MLKQVQHDKRVWFWFFCHPEPCAELVSVLFRDLGFGFRIWVLKPRPVSEILYYYIHFWNLSTILYISPFLK
jgi:hypothetical protein